ncbi:accessory factor associated with RNA polymerase II [Irineochytrium annulatum]|nr:accessory factor associated with RNA polymerase II [Irineochytrium annulatum]
MNGAMNGTAPASAPGDAAAASRPPLVKLLRAATMSLPPDALPPLLTASSQPTTTLPDAASVILSGTTYPVTHPSNYKDYTLQTLLFFLTCRGLEHSAYMQRSFATWGPVKMDVPVVSLLDRRDLLEYLTGVSKSSQWVDGGRSADGAGDAMDVDGGAGAVQAASAAAKAGALAVAGGAAPVASGTGLNGKAVEANGQVVGKRRPEEQEPVLSKRQRMEIDENKPGNKQAEAKLPIIVVPAAAQATLTMHNVKTFLVESKYIANEDFLKRGAAKPPTLILERTGNVPAGALRRFQVIDSIDKLKSSEDWDRVVAVFATGQEWQFKGWRWGAPVNIFAKVKGFCLKFQDEPLNDKVKGWTVKIHRQRRHLDAETVNTFWMEMDLWIRNNKGRLLLA